MGSGTQDVLLTDERLQVIQMKTVLPAPTQLYASIIKRTRQDIFCDGYTMGGGAISGALIGHAEKYRVVMTPEAARTVRDDPRQVEERGIEIGVETDMKGPYKKLTLKDVDMDAFRTSLGALNFKLPSPDRLVVAVAVQDHGVAPAGMSDRAFRFQQIGEKIKKGASFKDFIFTKAAPRFSRVSAVIRSLNDEGYHNVLVMDTKMAGILGGLYGEPLPAVVIDIGNGHTTAASISESGDIVGVFEHHTFQLTHAKMRDYIERLADGTLANEEVFEDGGHGAYVKEPIIPKAIIATGPRRKIALKMGLNVKFATPLEDVYMVGPVGMVRAYQQLEKH